MVTYKIMERTPTSIRYRVLKRSEVYEMANSILGKETPIKPENPVKKEEPVVPAEPEKVVEPVEEEKPVEEPVVETPVVEAPVVEEQPVEEQPVEEAKVESTDLSVLGLSANNKANLKANGITTVEELAAYINEGKALADLPKIGVKAESSILEAFNAWQNEQTTNA